MHDNAGHTHTPSVYVCACACTPTFLDSHIFLAREKVFSPIFQL